MSGEVIKIWESCINEGLHKIICISESWLSLISMKDKCAKKYTYTRGFMTTNIGFLVFLNACYNEQREFGLFCPVLIRTLGILILLFITDSAKGIGVPTLDWSQTKQQNRCIDIGQKKPDLVWIVSCHNQIVICNKLDRNNNWEAAAVKANSILD